MTKISKSGEMTSLIRAKVQNVFTSILMDSGAASSAIDANFAQQLGVNVEPLRVGDSKFL